MVDMSACGGRWQRLFAMVASGIAVARFRSVVHRATRTHVDLFFIDMTRGELSGALRITAAKCRIAW